MKRPAVQEQDDRRRVGDKREARLRKDPASWGCAPARRQLCPSVHPNWRALDQAGSGPTLPSLAWATPPPPHPTPNPGSDSSRGLNAQLSAGPGRILFTALSLSSLHPNWASRAQALHCCAPVAAMLGQCGGVWGAGGGPVPAWLRRTPTPHQQGVLMSMTLSRQIPV